MRQSVPPRHTSHRPVMDTTKFLKALTPAQRRLVTKRIIDKDKLDAAVAANKIPLRLVTKHTSLQAKRPYLLTNPVK